MNESIVGRLITARESNVTTVYDEAFYDVADRIADVQSASKADIGSLVFWKRLQANTKWARQLHLVPDADVRRATGEAREAALDAAVGTPEAAAAARAALSSLPGFAQGDALASAVITAAAPHRMAVYDRRAHMALRDVIGVDIGHAAGRYRRYMAEVLALLDQVQHHRPEWTAKDVDVALFALSARA